MIVYQIEPTVQEDLVFKIISIQFLPIDLDIV